MKREDALIEQYKTLMDVGIHYDQKLWLIPSAAYTVAGIVINAVIALDPKLLDIKGGLLLVSSVVFFGFLLQLIKDRAFQLGNQYALNEVKKALKMVETNEFAGIQPADARDRWFIRVTRRLSALNTVIYIMMISFLAQLVMACRLLYMAYKLP